MKKAFITGVTGQDGAWLSKLLLDKGYEVHGGVRRTSFKNARNLEVLGISDKIKSVDFDLLEYSNILSVIREGQYDEFYNLAAQSFVGVSFKQPIVTANTDAIAVAYILESLRTESPQTKFYQASTSEMFGKVQEIPQKETTPFYPRSPYGAAKLYAHWLTINYRESYDMFTASGILFNHESELRGHEFVTRKITLNVAKRAKGIDEVLELGNIDAKRDWGYAKEYVEGMWMMLQHEEAGDYVLATGKTTTIREFVEYAFQEIGKEIVWEGEGINEKGIDKETGKVFVQINKEFYRPAEVDLLIGDPTKVKNVLGWEAKTDVQGLAKIMVQKDIEYLR